MMSERRRHFLATPVFAVLGRSGGVLLPIFIAFYFGADASTDAFFLAFTLIVSLAGLFTPFFESLLVPYLAEHKEKPSAVASLSNGILLLLFPVALVLSAVLGFFLPALLDFASGLTSGTAALTGQYFFEMVPLLLFWIMASAGNGILLTYKIFWFPAVAPLLRSLTAIVMILAAHSVWGLHAATGGLAAGELLRWIIGLVFLMSLGKWKFRIDWQEHRAKIGQFMGQSGYQLTALLALNLIPFVDQWFASWVGAGAVTLISYANRLFQIPFQLAMSGFVQIFLSYWSENYIQEHRAEFWRRAKRDVRNAMVVSVLFSVFLILVRKPLIHLLYGMGELDPARLDSIATLFAWLVVGFAPAVLNLLYVRILYVMKKSDVFCVQSLIRLGLNVILNFIFMQIWGLTGIAMATAFVFVGSTVWLHRYLAAYWKKELSAA